MTSFTAIDFRTAHPHWGICQVGLVRVENGIVVERISLLVRPPNNFYWKKLIDIHCITPAHTPTAPTFEMIWQKIEPFIKEQIVVTQNGFTCDFHCLKQTLEYYNIPSREFTGHCTYRIFRDNLASLCNQHKIN